MVDRRLADQVFDDRRRELRLNGYSSSDAHRIACEEADRMRDLCLHPRRRF